MYGYLTRCMKCSHSKKMILILFIVSFFMSIGYASVNGVSLDINGEAVAINVDDIFITEALYYDSIDADVSNSNITRAYKNTLDSDIVLSNSNPDSSITFLVSIYNSNDIAFGFDGVEYLIGDTTYDNENIIFKLDGLEIGDVINAEETLSFFITFYYKDNMLHENNRLSSLLNFQFSIVSYDYDYTGSSEIVTLKHNGIYKVELWGAAGGSYTDFTSGSGSYTVGTTTFRTSDSIYITVGGKGVSAAGNATMTSGGFNGGGGAYYFAGTGGGSTDIRYLNNNLSDRIMVAAGGGGSGVFNVSETGGSGGTFVGSDGGNYVSADYSGYHGGTGGTQISGGIFGDYWVGEARPDVFLGTSGIFGVGGNGGYELKYEQGSGAGGGGYYGGGGGSERNGGGAGGSSFISGHAGCIAVKSATDLTPLINTSSTDIDVSYSYHYSGVIFSDTNMLSGNDVMPTFDGNSSMVGNKSNGYARITLLEEERE